MEESTLYLNFDKSLYRLSTEKVEMSFDIDPSRIISGASLATLSQSSGLLQSANFISGSTGWRWTAEGNLEGNSGTFRGTIIVTTGSIGGWTIAATALYYDGATDAVSSGQSSVDYPFYAGAKYVDRATAPYRVTPAGAFVASSATITGALTAAAGSVIATSYLSGLVAQSNLNIANMGWTQTCAFSSTDLDTVFWGAGTLTTAGGTTYNIGAGNTGNMAARTYIYLDIAVSTIAFQITTTASTAVGTGKILVATAINGAVEATFEVFGGVGGIKVSAVDALVANSVASGQITTGEFITLSAQIKNAIITDAKISGTLTVAHTDAKCTNPLADQTSANIAAGIAGQGALATLDVVELAKLGTTVVSGGYLQTVLVNANLIRAGTGILDTLIMGSATVNGVIQSYGWNGTANGFQILGGATPSMTVIGGTITSGTIQTAATGQRIVMSGSGNTLMMYNSAGHNIFAMGSEAGLTARIDIVNNDIDGLTIQNAAGLVSTKRMLGIYQVGATSSGNCIYAAAAGTGTVLQLLQTGSGKGVYVQKTTTNGIAVDISQGTQANALHIEYTNAGASAATYSAWIENLGLDMSLVINQDNASSATSAFYISRGGSGYYIYTNIGAYLSNAGVWTNASSKKLKTDFREINSNEILEKIKQLEIKNYAYKADIKNNKNARHITPFAEDFYDIMGIGETREALSAADVAGVALVGLQALVKKIEKLENK